MGAGYASVSRCCYTHKRCDPRLPTCCVIVIKHADIPGKYLLSSPTHVLTTIHAGAEDHYTQAVSQGKHTGVDLWTNASPGYGKNGTGDRRLMVLEHGPLSSLRT